MSADGLAVDDRPKRAAKIAHMIRRAGKGQTRCTGSLGACLRDRAKPDDNGRYLAQWQAEVRGVMEQSAHRHTWIASITRILHNREAAGGRNAGESCGDGEPRLNSYDAAL